MRNLVVSTFVSLDGVMQAPEGPKRIRAVVLLTAMVGQLLG
jgi:hypothetical protein